MKKIYELTYADGYQMRVEIDHSIMTDEQLHEINGFWGGAASRAARNGVLNAVLMMFCTTFMDACIDYMDPVAAFDNGDIEGWPPISGTHGIRVVDFEPFDFEPENVDVREVL
ncbi:DUF2528 family protein [Burkholderia territorii]|uniref:DUF2528 family protein n=1 Tax=Burkholderia territorii TaxID=1503055 RepID=UPI00075C6A88|nr:DUF2528 family protein [Burkholderia territorii]KWE37434.1 hypothetical protein WT49_11405 [Burkholderia territorii]KWE38474.1 hypothetical protein WT50_20260 [Burkholderia territorii]KWE40353.1 hypothetical protein WT51_28155 [Burkholderia territorii]